VVVIGGWPALFRRHYHTEAAPVFALFEGRVFRLRVLWAFDFVGLMHVWRILPSQCRTFMSA
jgi:hypothetical protein